MNKSGKAILKTLQFLIDVFSPTKKKSSEKKIEEKEKIEEI